MLITLRASTVAHRAVWMVDDACVNARPSSFRPKVTVNVGSAVQITRPKSMPHIYESELDIPQIVVRKLSTGVALFRLTR